MNKFLLFKITLLLLLFSFNGKSQANLDSLTRTFNSYIRYNVPNLKMIDSFKITDNKTVTLKTKANLDLKLLEIEINGKQNELELIEPYYLKYANDIKKAKSSRDSISIYNKYAFAIKDRTIIISYIENSKLQKDKLNAVINDPASENAVIYYLVKCHVFYTGMDMTENSKKYYAEILPNFKIKSIAEL